jgi:ribose transport system substrate-binding protein
MKLVVLLLAAAFLVGCSKEAGPSGAGPTKKITIGVVAKSQSNPVFQAAHQGAKDAAAELGKKLGMTIEVNIQTPADEDAQKQAQAVEQLANSGVDGIAVSCSNANTLQTAIDKAADKGVPVMCFDSDSPQSKRFAYYGTDDAQCGALVGKELAKAMGEKGNVAILAGNESAPNLQTRAKALRDELAKYPNMKVVGTFYHKETPEEAAAMVQSTTTAHPEINGWGFIGGWPLFTRDALKWPAGQIKVVSVDGLPAMLLYLKDGHVDELLAQDCYGWGHKSVEILVDKIVNKKVPASPKVIDPLTPVTKANVDEFGKNWDKWLGK